MGNGGVTIGRQRHQVVRNHSRTTFRRGITLQFYADTDHSGSVDESEREWRLRRRKPGAILVYNCDREDSSQGRRLDHQDDDIDNHQDSMMSDATALKDLTKLIVKQNSVLPADCEARVVLSNQDAEKVRGFDISSGRLGANPELGDLNAGKVTEYPMAEIRNRDYVFAFEAVKPVIQNDYETVEIHIVIRRSGRTLFEDFIYFTIAPWLLLSNCEDAEEVYVADLQDPESLVFQSALHSHLGGKLRVIRPASPHESIEQWVQDVIEIGFSNSPASRHNPMHQLINSRNIGNLGGGRDTRPRLFLCIFDELIGRNFGHIRVNQGASSGLDSYGNLEVTPPLNGYPFGRILYGVVGSRRYNSGHTEMYSGVTNLLAANKYQPPVTIPTGWLTVGHVDEILSFVPSAGGGFKLLIPSPRRAIQLCRQLKNSGYGHHKICPGKGSAYEISIDDFINDRDLNKGRHFNEQVQVILNRIKSRIIFEELGIPRSNVIEIPVLFKGVWRGNAITWAIALTADMVNCLVAKPDIVVPDPFGPRDGSGVDVFKADAQNRLSALGLNIHFIDDWEDYHAQQGEVHCGTNTKRTPPSSWRWWVRDLTIGGSRAHG